MTKTAREIVNELLGHDDSLGYHDDCKKEADQALKELEAIISQQVIAHEHNHWCFLHCPYKSVEGVQIVEGQRKALRQALYGKESSND